MSLTVRRKGKVFLLGEYAVLYGYPCLVASVGATLTVRLSLRKKEGVRLVSTHFPQPLSLSWEKIAERSTQDLVCSVLSLFAKAKRVPPPLNIQLTGSLKSEYGLGSSAALVVALTEGLWKLHGKQLSQKKLFDLSAQAVRQVQPHNSCADIACVVAGQAVRFQQGKFQPISLPFSLSLYTTGIASPTKEVVPQIKKRLAQKAGVLRLLGALVEQGACALCQNDEERFAQTLLAYHVALLPFSWSTLPIEKQYQRLLKKSYAAKLCGAGRGDCFIALRGKPIARPRRLPFSVQ